MRVEGGGVKGSWLADANEFAANVAKLLAKTLADYATFVTAPYLTSLYG